MSKLPAERFPAAALALDAQVGLTAMPQTLPPNGSMTMRGSELFEKITLPAGVLPTRAEAVHPGCRRPGDSRRDRASALV